MPSQTTLALAGVGALLAGEATGVTNVFGGGGGGGSPINIEAPGGGGGSPMPIPIPGNGGGGGGGGSGPNMASIQALLTARETQSNVETLAGNLQNSTERARENIGGRGPSTGQPRPGGRGRDSGVLGRFGPSFGNENHGVTERQKAAASVGRDPFGLQATSPGIIGTTAEVFRASGEAGKGFTSAVGTPGKNPEDDTFFGFVNESGRAAGSALRETNNAAESAWSGLFGSEPQGSKGRDRGNRERNENKGSETNGRQPTRAEMEQRKGSNSDETSTLEDYWG